MAVCEIWDVRGRLDHPIDYAENPEKTANPKYTEADLQAMVDVMEYAANKNKTEQRFFVTGVNCDPTTARDEMMITKAGWNDTSEIVCYHGFQSFKHGEVTPEQAHEVGVKLAERMWGNRFQVIVATHLNTDCLHNHFVVNSVSFADGMHYHDNKANLRLLRQRSDELCREYALSVIEHPSGKKKPYALYQAEKQGRPTRDNVARQAVDEAISKSFTLKDFDRQLAEMGYRINFDPNRKYWTIIGKGWQRPKRLYKLGEEYTNDRIMERIRENSYAVKFQSFSEPQPQIKVYRVKGSLKNAKKIGGLRGLYLHYCYKLGILPKGRKQNYARLHYLLKDDLMQESGGRGLDPMQAAEGSFNTRYPHEPNGIKDPEYSIECGVQELKAALISAEVENPIDMEHIKLALQGYNFGNGYISWAKTNYGGYSYANAVEFSTMQAARLGWDSYGDTQYPAHVLRYYPYGRAFTSGGNQAIVEVALTQLGNEGGQPYWSWYGFDGRVEWCACFVSWCADQCGYIESGIIPKFSGCVDGSNWFKGNGQWQDRNYEPQAGDIIFFDWEGDGETDHVGIVEKCENGVVYTVEGNSGDACRQNQYTVGSSSIYGYGVPAY
nr:relaxase/mobilization nuclease domain-containing protein [uncultured Blautia sp.]